jgi:uncharacterized HAD superfamily protein
MKIGIDLDSVVADLMSPLVDFHNKNYGTKLKPSDHVTFSIEKIWKCTEEEAIERCFKFYRSDFMNQVKPLPGAIEGINFLSRRHELHIITSRPHFISNDTVNWIKKFFPDKFKTIHHTNQYSKKGSLSIKKSEIIKKLSINLMIEDHLEYAIDCASLNIRVFLLDMPWNQTKKLPKNIIRVHSWKEIIQKIS